MVKIANDYGERKCLECKKTFEATYPAQVTCSQECQKKRNIRIDAEWHKQARASLWQKNKQLKAAMEELARLKGKPGKRAA